jgi:hypothetical protein
VARVIELPVRRDDEGSDAPRVDPPNVPAFDTVDDWGRDEQMIRALSPLAWLRWSVSVGGAHLLPQEGGALLVTNTRRTSLSGIYVSWALSRAISRPVRFVGRPDVAPVGPFLRRLGGLLKDPAEVEGALRAGEIVLVCAHPTGHPRHAGPIDHHIVGAAVRVGVPVHPVASTSSNFSRAARADVGAAVRSRRKRRGPLAEIELAEATQRSLQKMLDEFGGVQTGVPPVDWLAEG